MDYSLTKKLLRDWKQITRSNATDYRRKYVLKPHETNLHVWHFLLFEPHFGFELYFVTYIYNNSILLRCLTPSDFFPFNKNINISYLSNELAKNGLNQFILKIWDLLFNTTSFNQYQYDSNGSNIKRLSHLLKAWNRIMCKDFKILFPELTGYLMPGDYEWVKNLSKRLNSPLNIVPLKKFTNSSCQDNTANKVHFNSDEQCFESVNIWKRSHTKLYDPVSYQEGINISSKLGEDDQDTDDNERQRKRRKKNLN